MKKSRLLGAACACVFSLGFSTAASASALLGDTIQSCWMNTGFCSNALSTSNNLWIAWNGGAPENTAIVSDSLVEFVTAVTSDVQADFTSGGDFLTISMPSGSWAEVEFYFQTLNPNTTITDFSLLDGGGLSILETSFTDDSFYLKVASSSHGLVSSTFAISSVPVPAAAWLFGSGLLGLVGIARRKNA